MTYECKGLIDLGFYPNYSFEVGDIDGDGKKEIAALSTDGNTLRVFNIDGKMLFERKLQNNGCWGTPLPAFADLDHNGKEELLVPDGPPGKARIIALDADNNIVRERRIPGEMADDYGIAIPLLGAFKRDDDKIGVVAGVAGGSLIAFNEDFEEIWRLDGLRKDFGHEFNFERVKGEEGEVIAFTTVDHIRYARPDVEGDLMIVNSSGKVIFKKRVRDLLSDTHFDMVAIADFTGSGRSEILTEKGFLLDFDGNVIWDASRYFDHGQWIAHVPNPHGPGRWAFISELWGYNGKSRMLDSNGNSVWELGKHRHSVIDQKVFPGYKVAPTRVHAIDWDGSGEYNIVFGEQVVFDGHLCKKTTSHKLKIFVFSVEGELLAEIPYTDTRREGFFYNGEVRSRALDVDGDGRVELVFPRQDGNVMIIGKK
ncbi:hypothetical protein DRO37_07135 [Candidatus Bathyarchaeota archaeon]|nr:MAG: hypothetical protein DRO37_07135 [Candidatus Bathyarchaeota archaeon]